MLYCSSSNSSLFSRRHCQSRGFVQNNMRFAECLSCVENQSQKSRYVSYSRVSVCVCCPACIPIYRLVRSVIGVGRPHVESTFKTSRIFMNIHRAWPAAVGLFLFSRWRSDMFAARRGYYPGWKSLIAPHMATRRGGTNEQPVPVIITILLLDWEWPRWGCPSVRITR